LVFALDELRPIVFTPCNPGSVVANGEHFEDVLLARSIFETRKQLQPAQYPSRVQKSVVLRRFARHFFLVKGAALERMSNQLYQSSKTLLRASIVLLCVLSVTSAGHADERWLVQGELGAAMPLTKPQNEWYSVGATAGIGIYRSLAPFVQLGIRLRGLGLMDGDAPDNPLLKDPDMPMLGSVSGALRLRPFSSYARVQRADGFFLEGSAGPALTGDKQRITFEGALGYKFDLKGAALGPVVRYLHVLQPDQSVDGRDARIVTAGLEIMLFDAVRKKAAPAEPPPPPPPVLKPEPDDRDGDRVLDEADKCPEQPEDIDGFEDKDGCPDVDNDKDGIVDANDKCPGEKEDVDGFEDNDGCSEPDNDEDGFADAEDKCPNKAEVINGIDDHDGCPDQGLIVFKEGKVTLDETILFEYQKARVRSRARPALAAIAELWRQHPEWIAMSVEGHADDRGSDEFNRNLSEKRAKAVVDVLIELGFPPNKLVWMGHGASKPLSSGHTETDYKRNRRVEFIALYTQNAGSDKSKKESKKNRSPLDDFSTKGEKK